MEFIEFDGVRAVCGQFFQSMILHGPRIYSGDNNYAYKQLLLQVTGSSLLLPLREENFLIRPKTFEAVESSILTAWVWWLSIIKLPMALKVSQVNQFQKRGVQIIPAKRDLYTFSKMSPKKVRRISFFAKKQAVRWRHSEISPKQIVNQSLKTVENILEARY